MQSMPINETDPIINYSLTYSVKFAVLVTLQIPSILISPWIFAYFGSNRNARVTDHNHSILVLLLINFLQVIPDLSIPMNFFRLNGVVQPATSAFCTWWTWYEFSLNAINGFLMAWISLERHILIFHNNFMRNGNIWKRRLIHIAPLVICCLWGPLFFIYTVVLTPMCNNTRYFDSLFCGLPCYLMTNWGTFNIFFDVIFPTITIFISNLALFIRAVYQKMVVTGRIRNKWRRQKKMAFPLGLLSFVYLVVWILLSIAQLGQIYIDPTFLLEQIDTFNFLVYIVPLILPMVCLMSMPELIKKLKLIIFKHQQQTAVIPLNDTCRRQINTNNPSMNIAVTKF